VSDEPPAVSLRPVALGDEAFLLDVYASTRAAELALVDWDEEQKQAFVRMQFELQRRSYTERFPDAAFDVVLVQGEPAGRLYVDHRPDRVHIIDLALLPPFRGRGIGTALLRGILDAAGAAGHPVTMYAERYNRALRLYARLGFVVTGDEGLYVSLEWRPQLNTAS